MFVGLQCAVPENIHIPPTEGIGISWGWGFCKAEKFKEMYEAKLEFPEGWGVLEKIPSVGEVWIFFLNYNSEKVSALKKVSLGLGRRFQCLVESRVAKSR